MRTDRVGSHPGIEWRSNQSGKVGSSRPGFRSQPYSRCKSDYLAQTPIIERSITTSSHIPEPWQQISKLKVVRVGIQEAPNRGDQSASFSIIRSLQRLGFNGVVQLVLKAGEDEWGRLREKLEILLPGYKSTGPIIQTVKYHGIDCICVPYDYLELGCIFTDIQHTQSLGFWPMNCDRSWLKCEYGIVVPPFHWKRTRARLERPNNNFTEINLPDLANYQNPYKPDEGKAWSSAWNDQRIFSLLTIILESRKPGMHLLPVYGIHHWTIEPSHDIVVSRLIDGVRQSHVGESEKTIMLIMSPLEQLDKLKEVAGEQGVTFTNLMDVERWCNNPESNIEVIYSGTVSQILFEWICFLADLPLVQEGANTASFMGAMGRCYLSLKPDGDTPLPKLEISDVQEERTRIEQLGLSLTQGIEINNFYFVAVDLVNGLRPLLSEFALSKLECIFREMIQAGEFVESWLRKPLQEILKYSTAPFNNGEQEWLNKLLAANVYPCEKGEIPVQQVKAINQYCDHRSSKELKLSKLVLYRTVGCNLQAIKEHFPSLDLKLDGGVVFSKKCPRIINEGSELQGKAQRLADNLCDNLSELIPLLSKKIKQYSGNQTKLLAAISQNIFFGMPRLKEVRAILKPEDPDPAELGLYLQGRFGKRYFMQVQNAFSAPENNAVLCALKHLTKNDWNHILSQSQMLCETDNRS